VIAPVVPFTEADPATAGLPMSVSVHGAPAIRRRSSSVSIGGFQVGAFDLAFARMNGSK
jgi:hypothetical protein